MEAAAVITLCIVMPMPAPGPARFGWCKRKHAKVMAGCYETSGPRVREVYVREQVGEIDGWAYCAWDGTEPTHVKMFVRVSE